MIAGRTRLRRADLDGFFRRVASAPRREEFDKGRTVERAFTELGEDAAIAYLGDDATDEDAFAALGDRGLPVLVASRPRSTLARAWLVPPAEVLEFLGDWAAACSRGVLRRHGQRPED